MNEPGRGELEDLLRRALDDTAGRVHPAGDGLERIRARVGGRRRWLAGSRPGLAVATAAVLVVLAAAVPLYLRTVPSPHHTAGQALHAVSSAPHSSPSPGPAATTGPTPSESTERAISTPTAPGSDPATLINGDPTLPDVTTVWPYSSRREGNLRADEDVTEHVHPSLRDPGATALTFIRSFVGTGDSLVAGHGSPLAAGIGITVSTRSNDGQLTPVSLVYLVRVRRGDDAPYVVVDASTPPEGSASNSMTLRPGTLRGTSAMTVDGTVIAGDTAPRIASVKVELREPGQDTTLASQSPPLVPDDTPGPTDQADLAGQRTWTATLTPIRPLATPTGTVAAWTVDEDNHLLAFVAAPTR